MFLKEYKSLKGYLERYTVLQLGKLHIRLHKIKSADKTPFKHSHPFHYVSVILRGGYTEKIDGEIKTHTVGRIIIRRNTTMHRIQSVQPGTVTLFFTWKTPDYKWQFSEEQCELPEWQHYAKGVYKRTVFGRSVFAKFDKFWHVGHITVDAAIGEVEPSIDQTEVGQLIKELW